MALSISKAWDDTKAVMKSDGNLLLTVAAATILLPVALQTTIEPQTPGGVNADRPAGMALLGIVLMVITIAGQLAVATVALRRGVSVGEAIAHGFRRLLPVIAAFLIVLVPLFILAVALMMALVGADDLALLQAQLEAGHVPNSGALALTFLIVVAAAVVVGVKLMFFMPVAVAEHGGPIAMLKRSWTLTKGHFGKLIGFVLLFALGAVVLLSAAQMLVGLLSMAILGEPEPLSVAAVVMGLLMGAVQAVVVVVYIVMLSRLYRQLVPEGSQPASTAD